MSEIPDCTKFSPGSPEWRDCQERQFNAMIENPDKWDFVVSDEQRERIVQAHVQYLSDFETMPDVSGLRLLVGHQFSIPNPDAVSREEGLESEGPHLDVKEMTKFWTEFGSDMPDVMQRHMGTSNELMFVWADRKIASILNEAKLPYMSWEEREHSAHLKAPDTLRGAADFMEQAEKDGYALYHTAVDEGRHLVTWNFRRGRPMNVPPHSLKVVGETRP